MEEPKTDQEIRNELWFQAGILAFGTKQQQKEALEAIAHYVFVLHQTETER